MTLIVIIQGEIILDLDLRNPNLNLNPNLDRNLNPNLRAAKSMITHSKAWKSALWRNNRTKKIERDIEDLMYDKKVLRVV